MPIEWYPVGTVLPFGGGTVPAGWLLCDGAAVSRTGRADLFAVIGTAFGVGDGSTTFNVPSLVNRFPRGATINTPGTTGGSANHGHLAPDHTHSTTQAADHGTHDSAGAHTHDSHTSANRTVGISTYISGPTTHSSDGGHTHDAHSAHTGFAVNSGGQATTGTNNPPFLVFDYIIASFNTFVQSFSLKSKHIVTHRPRPRITHSLRSKHYVTHHPRVRLTHSLRSKHFVAMSRKLRIFRTFSLKSKHYVTHRPRPRITHGLRSNHFVVFSRHLEADRTFNLRSNHILSRRLLVRVTHPIRSDHFVAFTRNLDAARTFNLRSNHFVTLTATKIFVRQFNLRSNHFVTARICLDIEDLPDPTGGTTIKKIINIFDD